MLTSVVQLEAKKGIHMTLRDTVSHESGLKHTDIVYVSLHTVICLYMPCTPTHSTENRQAGFTFPSDSRRYKLCSLQIQLSRYFNCSSQITSLVIGFKHQKEKIISRIEPVL